MNMSRREKIDATVGTLRIYKREPLQNIMAKRASATPTETHGSGG